MRTFLQGLRKLKLVDRCLMILMALLLLQTIFNLFLNENVAQDVSVIDVVIRTTASAIFGYFLSANFIRGAPKHDEDATTTPVQPTLTSAGAVGPTARIGFADQEVATDVVLGQATTTPTRLPSKEPHREDQQIIIVTTLGVVALVILIVVRNHLTLSVTMVGTIAQMRDFVSGCVGFLLGTPGNHDKI